MAYRHLEELQREWPERRATIERRVRDFRHVGLGTDRELFAELAYCLFTPGTSAQRGDEAVRDLAANGLLWNGSRDPIAAFLHRRVRFHNHKAARLVAVRERFLGGKESLGAWLRATPPDDARRHLVLTVDGFGYKEASHFLRNVGRGEDFAILDRHILKNLVRHGVLRGIPASLTAKRYLAIEERVRAFADDVLIPMAAIDLLFWSRETGEVFK